MADILDCLEWSAVFAKGAALVLQQRLPRQKVDQAWNKRI
jgi:hypothetical protein